MTTVGVLGAKGKMGTLACAAIRASDDCELMAEVDAGEPLDALAMCEVVVDFTHPGVVMENLAWCVDHGLHVVVGTSGFTDERLDVVRSMLEGHPGVGVLVVPNFSIGAVLMMRLAAEAAPFFESVEIVEMHHPDKLDAPSGTALRTAQVIAAARQEAAVGNPPDATRTDELGARGGRADGMSVHSLRVRGAVAHQEVVLGATGQTLTIRHDSYDRTSFMPGVVLAAKGVAGLSGLTLGLDALLDR